ncbi:MAG: hypothetical protein GXP47_08700 [Acidobacteria bacterium]|nr:hypothetical protein [Acidobacteriota bacterium]
MRRALAAACVALSLWGVGCAPALHEHPKLASGVQAGSGRAVTREALLEEARHAWASRPDVAAVLRARQLFLEAAQRGSEGIEGLLGAAGATAWLVEHLEDPEERGRLAGEGVGLGQLCLQRAPGDPRCRYRLALALGQQARERPSTGLDGVRRMVKLLRGLTKEAPALDHGGPERVLALVLLRAPGWPAGPGDPEEGLEQARRAVALAPEDARNRMVLAEALLADGQKRAARKALERARELARKAAASGDPDAPARLREIERLAKRCNGQRQGR